MIHFAIFSSQGKSEGDIDCGICKSIPNAVDNRHQNAEVKRASRANFELSNLLSKCSTQVASSFNGIILLFEVM